jgi:hypothetical protein
LRWPALAVVLIAAFGSSARADGCQCAAAREMNGWCAVHATGYIGGLEVKSAWLFETLDAHGHDLDLTTFTCPACRLAIASDGYCDEHRIGFVKSKAYFSWLTYALAHGSRRRPAQIACATCRSNAASHGWCDRDHVGMIGVVVFPDRSDFDRTVHALEIVMLANDAAKRCDYCAAAIVTDTECPICKIAYKDGKRVARQGPPPTLDGSASRR